MNWKDSVTEPDEIKVFSALDAPTSTWRTLSGVARQTALPETRVWEILKKYNMGLTILSDSPTASGSPLVGLLEKVG